MPPSPIILLAVLMIGYPLVQIAAIRFRRPTRLRMHSLARALKTDVAYGEAEQRAIDGMLQGTKGGAEALVAPIMVPIEGIISTIRMVRDSEVVEDRHLEQRERKHLEVRFGLSADAEIWKDPRFRKLNMDIFTILFASYPIACGLTLVTTVPVLIVNMLLAKALGRRSLASNLVLTSHLLVDRLRA